MTAYRADSPQLRVLLRTVTPKDGALSADVLGRAGIATRICADLSEMVSEIACGAGALLLAEETLLDPSVPDLIRALTAQPPWSDLPMLVLARQGADSRAIVGAMDVPANVTVIERPLRVASLVSAMRSALRARRRQYELRDLLDGLREADQRKTEFLATLAHELRNPLAPLRTTIELLLRDGDRPVDAHAMYALMGRQVDHMVRLVNDLMEVSRVTRAKIDLQREEIDIDQAIRAAVEQSRPLIESSGHRLDIQGCDTPLQVRGDAVRLAQVFSNLLNNAAKYTPHGGRIAVRVEPADRNVNVRIEDDGIGIPDAMLDSVFDMFVQVSDNTRAAQGGLGIGLTLVKSLVELHGGSVRASRAQGGTGTCVTVTLPLLADAPADTPVITAPRASTSVREKILIVDDNRDAADALAALLKLLGARVAVAYDGADALKKAAILRPSIAVLDIGMPGMDGCELARRLREDPQHADIRLIALTGWGQHADRERIAAAGFDRHLIKPVDLAELTGTLQQLAAHETPRVDGRQTPAGVRATA